MMAQKTHLYETGINCSNTEQNVNSVLLRGDCVSSYGIVKNLRLR